jgi:hypothetical protein
MRNPSVYFADDTAENCISYLSEKSDNWYKNIQTNRYLEKMLTSWAYYYGQYYDENHQVSFTGESGEIVNLAVNHFSNIGRHILNMVTGSRPAFQCMAVNNDRKSMIQAELGNNILNYYMREGRFERKLKKATEYAIVMGTGYILTEWNPTKGGIDKTIPIKEEDIASYDEHDRPLDENGNILKPTPLFKGDIESRCLSPLDVVFDFTKEDPELNDWYLVRTFVNKFDLIAIYPEYKEELLSISTEDQVRRRITLSPYDMTVDIPVYQFFHRKTESMTDGRYLFYVTKDIVLDDVALPYPDLPIQRISPADILGSSFGYTTLFDLIPIQTGINSVYSTLITNHHAFGVQNVINPIGNNVKFTQVSGGMNWIEYDKEIGPPEALQLTKSSPDSYNLLSTLEKVMETVSAVNSVARGNPEASLKSGTALAMIQAQALQFMSGLQQTYIQLLEDSGTSIINLLKEFAEAPKIIAISGITNATKMIEFNNKDIQSINRVLVEVSNPLMNSTAGRTQIADNLLQMGLITTPEKYLEVLNTGNLSSLTKGTTDELDVIRAENEALLKGQPIIAISIDHHAMHIRNHRDVLSDPVLRMDQDLVVRTLNHINEHLVLLRETDPALLSVIGEQPIGPQGGSPPNPQGNQQVPQGQAPMDQMMSGAPQQNVPGAPSPAKPPGQFEGLPQTPEELMNQQVQG